MIIGHTHQPYNCEIDGNLVTSAFSFGRLITKIDLTIYCSNSDVTDMTTDTRIVIREVKNSLLTALIDKYKAIAAPLENGVIGSISADINRSSNAARANLRGAM